MKKLMTVSVVAALLAICSPSLLAQDTTNTPPNAAQTPDAAKKGAQMRQILAILGMDRKDLKGLAPEDRRAKIKDAADKKIAELQQKKADGTLTDKEQSNLALLQKFEQHGKAKKSDT